MGNHQKSRLPDGCLDLVKEVPGVRRPALKRLTGSRELQRSSLASIPGQYDTSSKVFNGNNGTSSQPKVPPCSLQMYDVDTITFPFVEVLFHLEVKVGAT